MPLLRNHEQHVSMALSERQQFTAPVVIADISCEGVATSMQNCCFCTEVHVRRKATRKSFSPVQNESRDLHHSQLSTLPGAISAQAMGPIALAEPHCLGRNGLVLP